MSKKDFLVRSSSNFPPKLQNQNNKHNKKERTQSTHYFLKKLILHFFVCEFTTCEKPAQVQHGGHCLVIGSEARLSVQGRRRQQQRQHHRLRLVRHRRQRCRRRKQVLEDRPPGGRRCRGVHANHECQTSIKEPGSKAFQQSKKRRKTVSTFYDAIFSDSFLKIKFSIGYFGQDPKFARRGGCRVSRRSTSPRRLARTRRGSRRAWRQWRASCT